MVHHTLESRLIKQEENTRKVSYRKRTVSRVSSVKRHEHHHHHHHFISLKQIN